MVRVGVADNQSGIDIPRIFVHVMNFCVKRECMPKGMLGANPVQIPRAVGTMHDTIARNVIAFFLMKSDKALWLAFDAAAGSSAGERRDSCWLITATFTNSHKLL